MQLKFKVGDRVNIKPRYRSNRKFVENGIITHIDNYEDIAIRWPGTKITIPYYCESWLEYADNALQKLKKRYAKKV